MNPSRAKIIAAMIDNLASVIRIARAHSLAQAASLLEMAKLDLQTELHGITDEELRVFCLTVDDARTAHETKAPTKPGIPPGGWWSARREAEVADGLKFHERLRTRAVARRGKAKSREAREPVWPKDSSRQSVVGNARKKVPSPTVPGAKHEAAETTLPEASTLLH
jgi:hypothetical protein